MDSRKLETAALRDVLTYGIAYVDLLENKRWDIEGRKWMPEIYSVLNPYYIEKYQTGIARKLVVQKSTQCGMSTMGMVRLFHFADFWSTRQIYMLPRQQDYIDFVGTRVDPIIKNSERLSNMLGEIDSTRSKQLGNSFLFFMESTVEPRMMPADAVWIDELDLSDMSHVSTAQNRMDDSKWRISCFYSTPTIPNYGINAQFETSDKREWFNKCPSCGHWQNLDWDINLRVIGSQRNPKKVFFGCSRCDHEFSLPEIQNGQWIPEFPGRSSEIIGFHVSQIMSHPAARLWAVYRDPHTKITEFYRKNLGKPRELGEGSLEREDVLAYCFDEPFGFELSRDGSSTYYMGVDQGNELQVLIAKTERGEEVFKIVYAAALAYEDGFEELGKLIRLFKPAKVVIDADPNRHSARDLQDNFLGKVLLADYTQSPTDWTLKKNEKGISTNVVIGRSEGFDNLFSSIKRGEWLLPGQLPNLPPNTEMLIDHVTAIKRDLETRRLPSGEKDVVVWRELRPAHLAHAWLYLLVAILVSRGKDLRTAVINASKKPPEPEIDETTVALTSMFAEVPLAQLDWYLTGAEGNPPFPLRHKLSQANQRGFSLEDIERVIRALHKDKLLTKNL